MTDQPAHTHFDLTALPPAERYKLLTACVVPRPVAWVCTLDEQGRVNLAPFSFFGLMGSDPPVVAFAPGNHPDGTPKDTARNISGGADFTVNLVSRALAEVMNATATEFPSQYSEPDTLGIELVAGLKVRTPRVALSPAVLECREVQTLLIGRTRIVLGEVLGISIRADAIQNAEEHYVDTAALDLIGRMGGRGGYATTRDTFEIRRIPFEEWQQENES